MGKTGVGEYSGYMQQPDMSPDTDSGISIGIEIEHEREEVHVMAGNNTKAEITTTKLGFRFNLRLRIFFVVAVVGCLLGTPLTRVHKCRRRLVC